MRNKYIYEKVCISLAGVCIGEKLGLLFPALSLLTILMVVDYISGMTDSYAVNLYKKLLGIELP